MSDININDLITRAYGQALPLPHQTPLQAPSGPGYKCLVCGHTIIPQTTKGMGNAWGAMVAHVKAHIRRGQTTS